MADKVELHLTGGKGKLTLEDLIKLLKNVTGRDPTQEEIEEARKLYEKD